MPHPRRLLAALAAAGLFLLVPVAAEAHQPWFEDDDFTATTPFAVANPAVSTAVYATLDNAADVDYFRFSGAAGDEVLLEITIPRIDGQETFTPTLVLLGPGLSTVRLPMSIERPAGAGGLILRATGEPTVFDEPFSGTSYWERQSERVTLPRTGDYVVAVWSETSDVGRYTFVIGDREVPGGDRQFGAKLAGYWTAVEPPPSPPAPTPTHSGVAPRCGR